MGLYTVHDLDKSDVSHGKVKLVRIRAAAFLALQSKRFIIRITSTKEPLPNYAYFEAEYAESTYRNDINGNDLVFMSKSCKKSLMAKTGDKVQIDRIQAIQEKELQSLYSVHTALSDDSNEGWIWIKPSSQNSGLREKIEGKRRIVRIEIKASPQNANLREEIKNKKGKDAKFRRVYSEVLFADVHYLENWREKKGIIFGDDDNFIFISAWFRHLLGIENIGTPMIIDLDVKVLNPLNLLALLYLYPHNHPQAVVLVANMMGIIGVGLGIIGAGLGVDGLKDWLATHILSPYLTNFWTPCDVGFVIFGLAVTLLGIIGFFRR